MKIIRKADQLLTSWTGGTTRQIYIFPEGSTYAERNFQIRISTATVEAETSTFTSLPGYFRRLMVLEGELHLEHEGQHEAWLKKFDEDSFLGEWKTVSHGKAADFNAMCTEQYETMLSGYQLEASKETLDYPADFMAVGIYLHKGECNFTLMDETHFLSAGDFVLFEGEECRSKVQMENTEPMEIVRVVIQKLF